MRQEGHLTAFLVWRVHALQAISVLHRLCAISQRLMLKSHDSDASERDCAEIHKCESLANIIKKLEERHQLFSGYTELK